MQSLRTRIRAALAASLLTCVSPLAWGGNDEGIPIGSRASLMGGAVTAADGGVGSVWYNPAGVAHTMATKAQANVSVYGLDLWSTDAVIETPDGTQASADFINWKLLPSTFGIARKLGDDFSGAFVVLVPRATDTVYQARATDASGDYIAADIVIGSSYYFGFNLAWRASKTLRFGATLFGLYSWYYHSGVLSADTPDGNLSVSELLSESRYGLRMNAGMQWDVSSNATLGLSVTSPSLILLTTAERTTVASGAWDIDQLYQSNLSSTSDWKARSFDPLKIRAGLLLQPSKRWDVEADLSFSTGVRPAAASDVVEQRQELLGLPNPLDRHVLVNGSVGAVFRYNDTRNFAAGLFTDLNPYEYQGINFAGVTFGMAKRRVFSVSGRKLEVESTLGGRYALGLGDGATFLPGLEEAGATYGSSKVTVHELSLNVGMTLQF